MKKIMTMIVVLLLLGSNAFANGKAELKLRTNGNFVLKVIIDGQLVSSNTNFVEIKNIPFGNHSLQVFKVLSSYNSYNEEPLFFGEIFLPQNTVTMGLIKHHKFIVEKQLALNNVIPASYYNYGSVYNTKPIFWNFPNQSNSNCNLVNNYQAGYNHAVQQIVEVFPMNQNDFYLLKESINNQWFSDGKLQVMELAVSEGNMFTAKQVTELVELYSFSGDRLAVAKLAYRNTINKDEYFIVFDSLHWNSSVENLNNYIASL